MKGKRVVSILLIMVMALSSLSVVYGMEGEIQGEPVATEGSIDDGATSDSGITDGSIEDVTSKDAITPQPAQEPEKRVTAALIQNYFVQKMSTAGTLTKVGTGYETLALANTAMKNAYSTGTDKGNRGLVVTDKTNKVINMISGIAYFNSSSATKSIGNTYITPKDAMHFFSGTGTSATVGISGVKVSVAVSGLILVPETLVYSNTTSFYYRDYYTKNSSGDLVHYTYRVSNPTTTTPYKSGAGKSVSNGGYVVDRAPSWMSIGGRYYSFDGINFYSNSAMTTKVGSSYYAYYKFLPYRSTTGYNYTQLNKWIAYKTPSVSPTAKSSKLLNQGSNLINGQNKYGINAVTELAFACLESAYGKSSYALNRNNLFGINAVDSNPDNAYSYSSVASNINEHMYKYLSRGYGDAKSDSRYYGLTPGSKAVGVNVKYASDPWHGEKISGIAYSIDKYLGSKDYRKYSVGVTNKNSVSVYKYAGSTYLYNLSTKSAGNGPTGVPVIILGSYADYYVIQSDLPISGNTASYSYAYSFSGSKAYVRKSDITKVNSGTVTSIVPSPKPPAAKAPAPKATFKFGVYNSKTKLSNKSKRGKRTTQKNRIMIQTKVKTNSKRTSVKMYIYNSKKKLVAQKVQYIYKTKTVKFSWNGKYTYHNKLRKKAGRYAPYSKKGTKYYVRFVADRSGVKAHKGKYHAFYLYK